MKTIDEIAEDLSYELLDVYYEALGKALDGSGVESVGIPWEEETIIIPPTRHPSEAPLNEQIRAVSNQLRRHSERFTVELFKRLFDEGYRLHP